MKDDKRISPDAMRVLLAANERAQDEMRIILPRILPGVKQDKEKSNAQW